MNPTLVNSVDLPMTIEEFNTFLHSDAEADRLISALRALTTIEQPEEIVEGQARVRDNHQSRGDRDLQRAQKQAEELANEQKEVASDVNGLESAEAGAGRQAKAQVLGQPNAMNIVRRARELDSIHAKVHKTVM